MNKKLLLLGLLWIDENHIFGERIMELIVRKDLERGSSLQSIINYLKETSKNTITAKKLLSIMK